MKARLIFPSRLSETGLGSGRRIVKIRSPGTANITVWTTLALIADASCAMKPPTLNPICSATASDAAILEFASSRRYRATRLGKYVRLATSLNIPSDPLIKATMQRCSMRSSNAKYETGMLAIDPARPGSVTTNTIRRLVRSTHGPGDESERQSRCGTRAANDRHLVGALLQHENRDEWQHRQKLPEDGR